MTTLNEYIFSQAMNKRPASSANSSSTLTGYFINKMQGREESGQSFEEQLDAAFKMLGKKTSAIKTEQFKQIKIATNLLDKQQDAQKLISEILSLTEERTILEKQFYKRIIERERAVEVQPVVEEPEEPPEPELEPEAEEEPEAKQEPPEKPSKLAAGGTTSKMTAPVEGTENLTDKNKQIKFADTMQLQPKASGVAAVSVLGEFLSSLGPLAGFFKPYVKNIATPFALSMGVGQSIINGLLGGPVQAGELKNKEYQKEFGKTWSKFLGDENFISLFIDRSFSTGILGNDEIIPEVLTGTKAEKSIQFAKYLMSKHGLTDFQAAAIVGVMLREGFGSGYPDVREYGGPRPGRGAPTYGGARNEGYGWIQWTNTSGDPTRTDDRLNRALIHLGMGPPPKQTRPWTDMDNIKVMEYEWKNHYTRTLPALKKTTNITDAVYEFVGNYTAGSHANIATYQGRESKSNGGFIGRRNASAAGVLRLLQGDKTTPIDERFAKGNPKEEGGITGDNQSPLTPYLLSGPFAGYDVNIQGHDVTMHGAEVVVPFEKGFQVFPVMNRRYDIFKDPIRVADRWKQIAQGFGSTGEKAQDGISLGVKAIQHDEALSSLSRGKNDYIVHGGNSVISSVPWGKLSSATPLYAYETGVSGDRTTIGWGMTYYDSITAGTKAVKPGQTIKKQQADAMLKNLVVNYTKTLSSEQWYKKFWNKMSSSQQAGLLAYGYNQPAHLLGTGAPKMYAALNRGDMRAVAANIDRGLPAREKNEKRLILNGPTDLTKVKTSAKPRVVVNQVGGGGSSTSLIQQVQQTITRFIPIPVWNGKNFMITRNMVRAN